MQKFDLASKREANVSYIRQDRKQDEKRFLK